MPSDAPLLPDEYTILCVAENSIGFLWRDRKWISTEFEITGKRLIVKSSENICRSSHSIQEATSELSATKNVCLNIRKVGRPYHKLGSSSCTEWYMKPHEKWLVRIICDFPIIRLNPNGGYQSANIYWINREDRDYNDSLELEVGKCSMITP